MDPTSAGSTPPPATGPLGAGAPWPSLGPALLAALGAAALLARLPGLGRSLWHDELFTLARFASPAAAFGEQAAANNHPLASLLAWGASLWGESEVALRAPFVLLGAAAVPALAWSAARALGARTGLLAGALAALAPLHVAYAQQIRGYAGLLLAAALLPGLLAQALRRPAGAGACAGLAATVGLGLLSHATLLLPVAGYAALVAAAPRWGLAAPAAARRALAGLGGGLALAGIGYAPTVDRLAKYVRRALAEGDLGADGRLGADHVLEVLGGGPWAGGLVLALVLLGLAAALPGSAPPGGEASRRTLAGGLLLAIPVAAALVLLALRPPAYARFLLFALPGALALAARGLSGLGPRLGAALLLVPLLGLFAWGTAERAAEELQDVRGAARLARERVGPDGVVIAGGSAGFLLRAYAPEAVVAAEPAEVEAALAGERPLAYVALFPSWTPPEVRARLHTRCGPPLIRPGRHASVAIYTRR